MLGSVLLDDIANSMLCKSDECGKVIAETKRHYRVDSACNSSITFKKYLEIDSCVMADEETNSGNI
jgi:hypothetical protein